MAEQTPFNDFADQTAEYIREYWYDLSMYSFNMHVIHVSEDQKEDHRILYTITVCIDYTMVQVCVCYNCLSPERSL